MEAGVVVKLSASGGEGPEFKSHTPLFFSLPFFLSKNYKTFLNRAVLATVCMFKVWPVVIPSFGPYNTEISPFQLDYTEIG